MNMAEYLTWLKDSLEMMQNTLTELVYDIERERDKVEMRKEGEECS